MQFRCVCHRSRMQGLLSQMASDAVVWQHPMKQVFVFWSFCFRFNASLPASQQLRGFTLTFLSRFSSSYMSVCLKILFCMDDTLFQRASWLPWDSSYSLNIPIEWQCACLFWIYTYLYCIYLGHFWPLFQQCSEELGRKRRGRVGKGSWSESNPITVLHSCTAGCIQIFSIAWFIWLHNFYCVMYV